MESAAARRALRRVMERRLDTIAHNSNQTGEAAAPGAAFPAGNTDVLPSLVSFDFASSLKLGLEKENQRRHKDLRDAAIAASSAGLTPTNAAVFGPALPLDVVGCGEEVPKANAAATVSTRRTTLRRGRLIGARVCDKGSALEVSVAVARRRRLRPLSPASPSVEIRQHLRSARPARPIAVPSLPPKVVAARRADSDGAVDDGLPPSSMFLRKTGLLPTDFLSRNNKRRSSKTAKPTRKQRPLRSGHAVMQSRRRQGRFEEDDRVFANGSSRERSSARTTLASSRGTWGSTNAQHVRRPSTTAGARTLAPW